jgi:hypothetical protein
MSVGWRGLEPLTAHGPAPIMKEASVSTSIGLVASFLVADHDLDARSILATIAKNRIRPKLTGAGTFDQITRPTSLQRSAFDLLGAKL